MLENLNKGYIYIYKCIVGSKSDVCKIGKTKHFHDGYYRLKQHGRTLYYGFVPYTDFTTGFPIATGEDIKASVDGNYDFNKDGVYNLK